MHTSAKLIKKNTAAGIKKASFWGAEMIGRILGTCFENNSQ